MPASGLLVFICVHLCAPALICGCFSLHFRGRTAKTDPVEARAAGGRRCYASCEAPSDAQTHGRPDPDAQLLVSIRGRLQRIRGDRAFSVSISQVARLLRGDRSESDARA